MDTSILRRLLVKHGIVGTDPTLRAVNFLEYVLMASIVQGLSDAETQTCMKVLAEGIQEFLDKKAIPDGTILAASKGVH